MQSFRFSHKTTEQNLIIATEQNFIIEYNKEKSTISVIDENKYWQFHSRIYLHDNLLRTKGTAGKAYMSNQFFLKKLVELSNSELNPAINFKFVIRGIHPSFDMMIIMCIDDVTGDVDCYREYELKLMYDSSTETVSKRVDYHMDQTKQLTEKVDKLEKLVLEIQNKLDLLSNGKDK